MFQGYFENAEDVYSNFQTPIAEQDNTILFAEYDIDGYDGGSAVVVFHSNTTGKYYEVHGSHCSCYGLEGQWEPEEVQLETLLARCQLAPTRPNNKVLINIINKELGLNEKN